MNHDQVHACGRLRAAATVAQGSITVESQDVRHLLDALDDYDRQLRAATREIQEAKTQLLEHAVVTPRRKVPTPAEAGS